MRFVPSPKIVRPKAEFTINAAAAYHAMTAEMMNSQPARMRQAFNACQFRDGVYGRPGGQESQHSRRIA